MDSFIHPTAKAYFNKIEAAGGTVSDKRAVNSFVWRLSRIVHPSLWVCWPLRSSQNIGTGTTAYSLGGLGDFPGTLTNGPTWLTTGVRRASGANAYISIAGAVYGRYLGQFSAYSVTRVDVISDGHHINYIAFASDSASSGAATGIHTYMGATANNTRVKIRQSGSELYSDLNQGGSAIVGQGFVRLFGSVGPTPSFTRNIQINSVSGGTSAGTPTTIIDGTSTGGILIGQTTSTAWDATSAFGLWIVTQVTNAQGISIDALYKQTLGQGLGLS